MFSVDTSLSNSSFGVLLKKSLEKIFDTISRTGNLYFWRYDILVKDIDLFFEQGIGFKILEINIGPQTMALQAFDKNYSLFQKYAIFAEQIKIVFSISKENFLQRDKYTQKQKSKSMWYFLFVYIKILKKLDI